MEKNMEKNCPCCDRHCPTDQLHCNRGREHFGLPLEEAGFATSVYFIFRTAGCFSGAFILRKVSARAFFILSTVMMLVAMGVLLVSPSLVAIYVGVALVGFGNSSVFSISFSQARRHASPVTKVWREPDVVPESGAIHVLLRS